MQKMSKTEFRIEKVMKKKGDKLYVEWKGYDRQKDIVEILHKMSKFLRKPYEQCSGTVKSCIRSNYATKADLKGATDVDTSNLASK